VPKPSTGNLENKVMRKDLKVLYGFVAVLGILFLFLSPVSFVESYFPNIVKKFCPQLWDRCSVLKEAFITINLIKKGGYNAGQADPFYCPSGLCTRQYNYHFMARCGT
jgi:hypothetical protein